MGIGDIVAVIVNHPDGIMVDVQGNVGLITEVREREDKEFDYMVHTISSDFVYGGDQIRKATNTEVREALYEILSK